MATFLWIKNGWRSGVIKGILLSMLLFHLQFKSKANQKKKKMIISYSKGTNQMLWDQERNKEKCHLLPGMVKRDFSEMLRSVLQLEG